MLYSHIAASALRFGSYHIKAVVFVIVSFHEAVVYAVLPREQTVLVVGTYQRLCPQVVHQRQDVQAFKATAEKRLHSWLVLHPNMLFVVGIVAQNDCTCGTTRMYALKVLYTRL